MTDLEQIMVELLRRILLFSDRLPPTLAARALAAIDVYERKEKGNG